MDVLIVDDDSFDRQHIKRILNRGTTCIIDEAETVDEGLEKIRQRFYDVILLDHTFPQRNGIELLLELKGESFLNPIAIVMMSNSEDELLALNCIKAGAQDFISKTEITPFRLHRAIINAQTRFTLEQQLYQSYQDAKILSEHDSLTGLANRVRFDESLKVDLKACRRRNSLLALILIDLDHFKFINDQYGHDTGDQLLIKVVNRIHTCLRGNELFSRLGGDEFAITLPNMTTVTEASLVAKRILKVLVKPFTIDNETIKTGASIGISIYPSNGNSAKELFKNADIAMYRAKGLGRNQLSFFEKEMQRQFLFNYEIEQKLAVALEKNEFTLLYQPIINPESASMTGVESLIRWESGSEILSPEQFIPVAEKSRLINGIGRWVISKAIKQLGDWDEASDQPISMSINLSPVQLSDSKLLQCIEDNLARHDILPERIEFELTETALLADVAQSSMIIQAISDLGCRIALDDFGTGFSSLSHLMKYPIDTVKIDKSLLLNETGTSPNKRLLNGLVFMIRSLGLQTVLEGVEMKKHLELSRELAVNRIQGYYFERPISAGEFSQKYLSASDVTLM
ncbi:GGDEF domain-containing response regulator [Thalassomonas actiniarum]|uniref:EAL domain-containing protein n=1 Tax=Thalassomonas actiniarum TaxID=485447 RepID=A0AAE9YP72_9GAMM|nr:GGDEF domain-containing response regulator [Thalassomonas actiniarum]WDD97067.1 EAL domain-containing protein [Thalassomonas actiniarum]